MPKKERVRPGHWYVSETPEGRIQDWLTQWDKGHWDFYYTQPGQNLVKYFEKVTDGRKGLKILVPHCATTYDLIWFCERGHTVVGVDLAESAAQRIFKQYKQKPIIEDVPSINGKLYKNETGTFKFYAGNFFLFNEDLEGTFDFIWDSKAMCAVDIRDRPSYLKVIRRVMGPKCTMMLEFPTNIFPGDYCDVEYQDQYDFNPYKNYHGDVGEDGKPLKQEDVEEEEEELVIHLQNYCLRKRD